MKSMKSCEIIILNKEKINCVDDIKKVYSCD